MIYQIQSKNDLSKGATLVVRIPEEDLDQKALYTALADTPPFILPFNHKNIDGEIEFTYSIGARNKLQYSFGDRNPKEYAELWSSILEPLLECDDWFMKPFSFVLQTDHLYYDKNRGVVSYVYIPSLRDCSDTDALKSMSTTLATKCPATDTELQNKALMSLIQGFVPHVFLQMLKTYQTSDIPAIKPHTPPPVVAVAPPPPPVEREKERVAKPAPEAASPSYPQSVNALPDDIVIDLRGGKIDKGKNGKSKKPEKAKEKGNGIFGGKAEKKQSAEKPPKQPKPKSGGLFGKKNVEPQPLIIGAAAEPPQPPRQKQAVVQPAVNQPPDITDTDEVTQLEYGDVTQLESTSAKLRLVSNAPLPPEITVSGNLGGPFVIGRFDVSVGRKQADFEFDKSTKSVSRRHAAIEQTVNGYAIIDLSSSAGTFVNGQKIPPNVPHELTFGTRVSFGTSGADYVWEI
jgi:hypothetical protein